MLCSVADRVISTIAFKLSERSSKILRALFQHSMMAGQLRTSGSRVMRLLRNVHGWGSVVLRTKDYVAWRASEEAVTV